VDKYHLKFNHVGFRLVKAALEAEGLPWEKHDSFCETCALTRTKSHNHLDSKHSKEDCFPGEYLVCDAIGPLAKSPGGKKYWLFLRDKKSGYTMSFVVSSKAIWQMRPHGLEEVQRSLWPKGEGSSYGWGWPFCLNGVRGEDF